MTAVARLSRNVMRFSTGTIARIDRIAVDASRALRCSVSRATVARAAMATWLDAAEQGDPADTFAEIGAAIVKRGRKRSIVAPSAETSAHALELGAEEPAPSPSSGPP
jgi:predicted transcriptional regulator